MNIYLLFKYWVILLLNQFSRWHLCCLDMGRHFAVSKLSLLALPAAPGSPCEDRVAATRSATPPRSLLSLENDFLNQEVGAGRTRWYWCATASRPAVEEVRNIYMHAY